MSKLVKKFRKGSYDDDNYYSQEEYSEKKKRKDKQRKPKYYDEFESYEAHHRFNNKSQKFRTY